MERERPAARIARTLGRALTLRCPRCGATRLFPRRGLAGWFSMARSCALCGLSFERAQGYWVGAIYINYAATALIAVGGALLLWTSAGISTAAQLWFWLPFVAVFPLWFFRYSRSLWLALELLVNPDL
jgi:uncharacterized protein (DUF983 family)